MINSAIFRLAKLAIPLLMALSFVVPSLTQLMGSKASHQALLEVCTDQGIQWVKVSADLESRTDLAIASLQSSKVGSSTPQQQAPQSHQTLDHCPLCQLQALSSWSVQELPHVDPNVYSDSIALEQPQVHTTPWVWAYSPARAPPNCPDILLPT